MKTREIIPNQKDTKEINRIFEETRQKIKNPVRISDEVSSSETIIEVTTDVPSKMLPYPANSIIKYKPFTYGELEKFNSSRMSETDRTKFVLQGIITEGFDKSELSFIDFLFVALLRKLKAFDDVKFNYNFVCDECGNPAELEGNLKDIIFDDLEIPALPLIIDVDSSTSLELNPITVGSYLKLREINNDDNLMTYAECVTNMDIKQAYKIISGARGELIEILQEADRLLAFGSQKIECVCPTCEAKNLFGLGDLQLVIQPFRRSKDHIDARIRFGNRK